VVYKLVAAILLGNVVGGRMTTASHYNNIKANLTDFNVKM